MLSELEIRRNVERELGTELTDAELRYLDNGRFLERFRSGEIAVSGLAEEIRQKRQIFRPARPEQPTLPSSRDRGLGRGLLSRQAAISKILAKEAESEPMVAEFRSRYLHDGLILPTKVAAWIQRKAEKDGPATKYLFAKVSFQGRAATVSDKTPGVRLGCDVLHYGTSEAEYARAIPVAANGCLDRLRTTSELLAYRYGWLPHQATLFVLTGEAPPLNPIRVEYRITFTLGALSRLTLTVDPTLSPRELMTAYRQLRRGFLGNRYRSLSQKHIELALFWSSRLEKESDRSRLTAWNRIHSKWKYKAKNTFKRDCVVAVRRLLHPLPLGLAPIVHTVSSTRKRLRK